MICPYCGAEAAGSVCAYCGSKLAAPPMDNVPPVQQARYAPPVPEPQRPVSAGSAFPAPAVPAQPPKKKRIWIWIVAAAGVVSLLAMLGFFLLVRSVINHAAAPEPPVIEEIPDIEIPDIEIPDVEIPDVEIPDVEIPEIVIPGAGGAQTPAPDPDAPQEYQDALSEAESYADLLHMSKLEIFDQLTSEYGGNYSEEAAQYAVDHLQADWKENALEKARQYSDLLHMSKQGIYGILTSEYGEQFTEEEAQYAIDNLSVDWKQNALEKAMSYLEYSDMSDEELFDQLTSEYGEQFTAEEAQYAIDHLDD